MRHATLILALSASAALTGCSNRATITVNDGRTLDSRITGSDATTIRVEDPPGTVARADVTDIDHPGNVLMWVGGGLAVAALPSALDGGGGLLDDTIQDIGLAGVAVFGGMFAWGAYQYFGSTQAADEVTFGIGPGSAAVSGRF